MNDRQSILDCLFFDFHWHLLWRIIATCYCTCFILPWGLSEFGLCGDKSYFTYLTHWTILLCVLYYASVTTFTCVEKIKGSQFMYTSVESLQQISTTIAVCVVVAFYAAYIGFPEVREKHCLDALSVHEHGVAAMLVLIDFIITANEMPFWMTVWKPLFVVTVYLAFSICIAVKCGCIVYDQFDWVRKSKESVLNVLQCYAALLIIHLLLSQLKQLMLKSFGNKVSIEKNMQNTNALSSVQVDTEIDTAQSANAETISEF